MSKLVRINDQFYDRLQSMAMQNKRTIGSQLEYMIERTNFVPEMSKEIIYQPVELDSAPSTMAQDFPDLAPMQAKPMFKKGNK